MRVTSKRLIHHREMCRLPLLFTKVPGGSWTSNPRGRSIADICILSWQILGRHVVEACGARGT